MKEIKKAVVACKVFYQEILEIVEEHDYQNITVEFLPQGLHNKPDSTQMKDRIQEKIDELEEREDFDYIILAYGYCSGGVEGLKTSRAKLVVPRVHDCIPLLLGEEEAGEVVEAEAGSAGAGAESRAGVAGSGAGNGAGVAGSGAGTGAETGTGGSGAGVAGSGAGTGANEGNNSDKTYFLSRGWIDCGGDVYKQHLHLTDSMQDWLDRFAAFQQENEEAEVDWQDDDSYHFKRKYSEEDAEFISFECLKGYEAVVLIDNDNLAPIHREYAEEKYKFVNSLLEKYRGRGIEFEEVKGDLSFLAELLFPEIYSGGGSDAGRDERSGASAEERSEAGTGERSEVGTDERSEASADERSETGTDERSEVGADEGSGKVNVEGTGVEADKGSGVGAVEGTGVEADKGSGVGAVEGTGAETGEESGKGTVEGAIEGAVEETGELLIFPPGEELKLRKHLLGSG